MLWHLRFDCHQTKAISVTLVYLVIVLYNSSKIWCFCCFSANSTDLAIQLQETSLELSAIKR